MEWRLLLLESDPFSDQLQKIPDSGSQNVTRSLNQVTNFFGFHVSNSFLASIGRTINVLDWVLIILIIVGFIQATTSLLGNNGEWKRRGAETVIWTYIALLATRFLPIIGLASTQIGVSKGIMFVLILISQILFFVGAPMVYLLGSQKLMLSEMSNNDQELDKSKAYFRWMKMLLIFGAISYFIAEVAL